MAVQTILSVSVLPGFSLLVTVTKNNTVMALVTSPCSGGRPQYVYAASDRMIFNITANSGGHISGNFSGRLTPFTNPAYGATGSVVITNGTFTNVPVLY